MDYGRVFKKIISDKGFTQEEIALKMGKTRQTLSRYLSGQNMGKQEMKALLSALEMTEEDFMSHSEVTNDYMKKYLDAMERLELKSDKLEEKSDHIIKLQHELMSIKEELQFMKGRKSLIDVFEEKANYGKKK